jgi:DNA end-binding protein Ku
MSERSSRFALGRHETHMTIIGGHVVLRLWSLRMAPRPNWKGFLKLSLVSCSVSLYPATSASERVSFNQINKNTGNRIRYKKVDGDSGEEVNQSDIIKDYQVEKNVYVTVEDEELETLQIESSHTIEIDKFVPITEIDERYFDSPYYIVPNDEVGQDAFAVIRDAMRSKQMVGLGRVVIAKRERPIILRPLDLEGFTLRYPYEVRKEEEYFGDIPDVKVSSDMLKLAERIVESKAADFDPSELVDHYEMAVVEMLKKKQAGKPIRKEAARTPAPRGGNVIDLLKRSLEMEGKKPRAKAVPPKTKTRVKQRA